MWSLIGCHRSVISLLDFHQTAIQKLDLLACSMQAGIGKLLFLYQEISFHDQNFYFKDSDSRIRQKKLYDELGMSVELLMLLPAYIVESILAWVIQTRSDASRYLWHVSHHLFSVTLCDRQPSVFTFWHSAWNVNMIRRRIYFVLVSFCFCQAE